VILIIFSTIICQTDNESVTLKKKKLAEIVELAKNGKRASEEVKLLRSANQDASKALAIADSAMAELENAYYDQVNALEIGNRIILKYEDIAKEGNRLVTTAIVGLITYQVVDGSNNEKAYVYGSMASTYLLTRLFGAPFDLFTIDLTFWN
jgi:hypothetical protein